jgi:tetratricopeptide (TPR) repeat protein
LTEAETLVNQMKNDPNREGWGVLPALILQTEAELALGQGHYEQAKVTAEEAISTLRQLGARAFLPAALYVQGRAWLGLGQPDTAWECWLAARAETEAIGSRRMLWQILLALSQLESNPTEAERLRQQAQEVVEYIADHSPPELRASFLALPAVRVVFN